MFLKQLKEQVQKNQEKIAVKDSQRQLTYKEMWDEAVGKRSAAMFQGVDEDTKILLMMDNCCDWVTNVLAFMLIGAKTVMISQQSTKGQVQELCSKLGIHSIITKENSSEFFYTNKQLMTDKEFHLPDEQTEVIYHVTSGSTGEVKICIRTLKEFWAEGEMFEQKLYMDARDVIVCPLPLYHSYAFGAVFISGLMTGGTLVLMDKFIPRKYIRLLSEENATLSFIVPVMAVMAVNTKLSKPVDLSRMKYIVVGAGAVTKDIFSAFQERFKIELSSNYGSSETGGIITRTDCESYPSIGKPMKGVSIQIRIGEGKTAKAETEGEMWVKADSIMNRYYDRADVFDKKGYFFTGDIAKFNNQGNYYITGRVKNIVNIGGKKVNPVYVENIFKFHPAIKDAVVVGSKRSNGEECLDAIITTERGFDMKELNQYLQKKLEQFMIPSLIKVTDTIPKNNMGKVNHEQVLKLLNQ